MRQFSYVEIEEIKEAVKCETNTQMYNGLIGVCLSQANKEGFVQETLINMPREEREELCFFVMCLANKFSKRIKDVEKAAKFLDGLFLAFMRECAA